jgi:SdrD B-like domain/Secretion system C-terminal sorting domain
MKKNYFILFFFTLFGVMSQAQISGTVFRDYNGNGVLELTGASRDTIVPNITVKAFNSTDALLATKITAANGTYSFSAAEIPAATKVRLEFTWPLLATACLDENIDFTGFVGSSNASSVQFVSGGVTNVNYAINNPNDYQTLLNPDVFTPVFRNGNPLWKEPNIIAHSRQSYDSTVFVSFPYNSTSPSVTNLGTRPVQVTKAFRIGTCWGVAYSKQTGFIYTSAILKRHSGMGPANGDYVNAPGSIYVIKRGVDSGSYFTSVDALASSTYWSHNHTKPIYNFAGTVTTPSPTFHVQKNDSFVVSATLKTNNGTRQLHPNIYVKVHDTAAHKQVGRVGLGGLEISEDGRYLYTINLYTKELIRIDLQNPYAPVTPSATEFTRWTLPALTPAEALKSILRPFALKFYRDKLYIGAVLDASISNITADLQGRVYEFDPATGVFTQILSHQLDYKRKSPLLFGTGASGCKDNTTQGWFPWTDLFKPCGSGSPLTANVWPQPLMTDIEFDKDGSLILSYSDRTGYQGGVSHKSNNIADANLYDTYVNGDILRAYRKNDCTFEIETNGKEGSSSAKGATGGANNDEGPIFAGPPAKWGEFYGGDNTSTATSPSVIHPDCAGGGLTLQMGTSDVLTTFIDPVIGQSNGVVKLSNQSGTKTNAYNIYDSNNYDFGTQGKSHGLGDLELVKPVSPLEIGNRVWNDANYNGIQDADEVGIPGVEFTLWTNPNNDSDTTDGVRIGKVITDANGNYLFSAATGTTVTGKTYGLTIEPNTNYIVRITNATIDIFGLLSVDFITTDGPGPGFDKTIKTLTDATGNGRVDWSDNDGSIFWEGAPLPYAHYQAKLTTGKSGQNNHSLDFGMAAFFNILSNQFITLKGFINNNECNLSWDLENKNDVTSYIIERSIDGVTYEKVAQVNTPTQLSIKDNVQNNNAVYFYYRIQLVEKNGRKIYSNTLKLKNNKYFDVLVLNNPVKENLNIIINTTAKTTAHLNLVSMEGKIIFQENKTINSGANQINIPINKQLSNGVYILKVLINDKVQNFKLILNQ